MRRSRLLTALFLITALPGLAACGSEADPTDTASDETTVTDDTSSPSSEAVVDDGRPLALVATDTGLAAVPVGSSTPRWSAVGAVAALDGTAVYSATVVGEETRITELERRTGVEVESWTVPGQFELNVVAPSGQWLALTNRPSESAGNYSSRSPRKAIHKEPPDGMTSLLVFDPDAGFEVTRNDLHGDVLPEAFSTDGAMLFTLRFFPDHYRVETVEVRTGEQTDTLGRDKKPGEDMHGAVVRGVLTPDRSLLSTLYRTPDDADEPAFVHVLDLIHGWAYCADLTAPFGTAGDGADQIVALDSGAVAVVHRTMAEPNATVAEINVDALHNPHPETPIAVTISETNTPPQLPAGVTEIDGYSHVVTVLDAS